MLTVITFVAYLLIEKTSKLIIILEKEKITEDVKKKLAKKGLSLIAMTEKEIIFNKIKHHFLHQEQYKEKNLLINNIQVMIFC